MHLDLQTSPSSYSLQATSIAGVLPSASKTDCRVCGAILQVFSRWSKRRSSRCQIDPVQWRRSEKTGGAPDDAEARMQFLVICGNLMMHHSCFLGGSDLCPVGLCKCPTCSQLWQERPHSDSHSTKVRFIATSSSQKMPSILIIYIYKLYIRQCVCCSGLKASHELSKPQPSQHVPKL